MWERLRAEWFGEQALSLKLPLKSTAKYSPALGLDI